MQINRLFEIVYLLLNKKIMTASELAAHFEVSKRTILRDLDRLSAAGIPIYTTRGKGGGISILDRFVLDKAVISKEEQDQILFALQSMAVTEHIDTESVLGRLQSLFEKPGNDWLEVDFSRWGDCGADKTKFSVLKEALINEQAVAFHYANSYGSTADRRVYPLKLIFKAKSWYLQAFCRDKNAYRTFKVNRMEGVEILAETFVREEFTIPPMEPIDYQSVQMVELKLRFAPQAAYRIYDEFHPHDISKDEEGFYLVSISLPSEFNLSDYVLSLGIYAEVLEPPQVREEIVAQIDNIKNIYQQR